MIEYAFNTRLKKILDDRGISQKDFADRIGVTEVSISRYMTGKRVPRATVIVNMANQLGVTTDYLLGNECDWCTHVFTKGRRFECYLIDDTGNTAPECINNHMVSTVIAAFCPVCGAKLSRRERGYGLYENAPEEAAE